jgi:hypothetical protein
LIRKKTKKKESDHSGVSRRDLVKGLAGLTLFAGSGPLVRSVLAEDVPPEPDNLDEPTQWQEGDPEPVEMTVPAEEPEQTSTEAPPSQPVDDERPAQPGSEYVWAYGYWWWTGETYVWVPGYWEIPPEPEYVYIPGYWNYSGTTWVYVRGGWGWPNSRVIVVYPRRRRVVRVQVIRAPRRIRRRHHRWRHYPHRRYRRVPVHRSPARSPAPARRPARPGTPRRTAPRRR